MVHGSHDGFEVDSSSRQAVPKYLTNEYNPYEVYSEPAGKEPKQVYARISPQVYGQISDLAASRLIDGLSTVSKIIADAIPHRLHTYAQMTDITDPIMSARMFAAVQDVAAANGVERRNQRRASKEHLVYETAKLLRTGQPDDLGVAVEARNSMNDYPELQAEVDREIVMFKSRWGLV